jgi:hypothetical protein
MEKTKAPQTRRVHGTLRRTALPRSLLARFRAVLIPNAMRAECVKAKEVTGTIASSSGKTPAP